MTLRIAGPIAIALVVAACDSAERPGDARRDSAAGTTVSLPLSTDTLSPALITETLPGDSDDPAIWIDPVDSGRSVVLGTDKGDTTGGVFSFDLAGRIDRARSVTPLQRMNNVDVEYGLPNGDGTVDIAVATERRRMMLRVFSLPDMRPIDGGGIPVFDGDTSRAPMGVALYRRPRDGEIFAIVSGKGGPTDGSYLAQYALRAEGGRVTGTLVREFGAYSGRKEIEAIAVDDTFGFVYYSDEGVGVRKYHADPDSGATELALFATEGVMSDHEGLAIYSRDSTTGYLLLSDQQGQRVQIFSREGTVGLPHDHPVIAVIPVRARETDGIEVTSRPLGAAFPRGLLVMMSDGGAFHYYRWEDVQGAIDGVTGRSPD